MPVPFRAPLAVNRRVFNALRVLGNKAQSSMEDVVGEAPHSMPSNCGHSLEKTDLARPWSVPGSQPPKASRKADPLRRSITDPRRHQG